jgi:hypothetical protein
MGRIRNSKTVAWKISGGVPGNAIHLRTLSVEWIRFLITFLDRIYRIKGIFFACGEIPLGRRPLYPDDPVNPV